MLAWFQPLLFPTPLTHLFSSPTPSKIASKFFNPPRGPVTKIDRLHSQANRNHSFNIVNSSFSFQSSLALSLQGIPSLITLRSNSPTPDFDQHSHQCIGKQTDTTRTYPTLPLKLDPKYVVPLRLLLEIIITVNNYIIGLNREFLKLTKPHQYKNNEHTNYLNNLKLHFSVDISVEQHKLIFYPQAAAPPIFRVKISPSHFICQEIHY